MVYLYNTNLDSYKDLYRSGYNTLVEYLEAEAEVTDIYKLLFVIALDDIFERGKKRTAYRGRFAKDQTGAPAVEGFAITDDERDFFDDIMKTGGAEVFRKLSAWSKDVTDAYKYGVSFGANSATGTIELAEGAVITDTALNLTVNALAGHRFVIMSGDLIDQERDIVSNTAFTITLAEPFIDDPTGLTFKTFESSDKHILYEVEMESTWDRNMLQGAEEAIKEALAAYFVKEWYLTNRYIDDAQIEANRYQSELTKIRSQLMQRKTPYRRSGELFS
jgi:hypothetical protein